MALIKPTLLGADLFGKIGGQNISLTKQGSVIRTTSYSNKTPTPKQSTARFIMSTISNKWQFLTPAEKQAWLNTSVNYTYVNSANITKTRSAFETFLFCNRNLSILNLPIITNPAAYQAVIKPTILNISTSEKEYIIQNLTPDANSLYIIFAVLHSSVGSISFTPNFILITILNNTEFTAGVNIIDSIKANLSVPLYPSSVTIGIYAINTNNGNRSATVTTDNHIINPSGLNLDILSYYAFVNNSIDFFGNNNAVFSDVSYAQNGVIDYGANYNSTFEQYINLGNNASFNFGGSSLVGPHSFCSWINRTSIKAENILFRVGVGLFSGPFSMELVLNNDILVLVTYSGTFGNRASCRITNVIPTSTNFFVGYSYTDKDNQLLIFGTMQNAVVVPIGAYIGMSTTTAPMALGVHGTLPTRSFSGVMSEVAFFNQALTYEQFMAIRTANLNGQSILNIN